MRVKKSRILEEEHIREYITTIAFMNPVDVRDGFVLVMGFMSGCRIAELYDMKRGGKILSIICFLFLMWTTSIYFVAKLIFIESWTIHNQYVCQGGGSSVRLGIYPSGGHMGELPDWHEVVPPPCMNMKPQRGTVCTVVGSMEMRQWL